MSLKIRTALGGGAVAVAAAAVLFSPSTAFAATTTAASPAPSAAAAACDRGQWGSRVEGVPSNFAAGDRGGDYLWHDSSGFHLRVTHKNDNRVVYTGQIASPTPMRMDPVKLEKGDVATLSPDRRVLTFAFADYGHIDGVNFHTDCAPYVTARYLNAGNDKLPANRVYLGRFEVHPAQVPFTVHRADTR